MATRASTFGTAFALVLACALAGAGCGGKKEAEAPKVPLLRFAGVNLEYALGRVATEAGWVLALDEINPKDLSPDLGLKRVDLDIPAGTLDDAMRRLRDQVGGFQYSLEDGIVYVRSDSLAGQKTSLDEPLLKGGKFHGDLGDLILSIMREHPSSFIRLTRVQDGFAGGAVDIEIPKDASVRTALVTYARAAKAGWVIRRSNELIHDEQGRPAVVGTGIQPLGPRPAPTSLPDIYTKLSGTSALADMVLRLNQPLLVYDRSALQDVRGVLDFSILGDPKMPLPKSLELLAKSGWGPQNWHFHYREEDGVTVLRTNTFLYYLRGRDFLANPMLGGDFEGSLPELARWINAHQKSPTGDVLMGGEIADGMRKGKIHVESGQTIHQVLLAFTKASGISPYVVVLDMLNPISGMMVERAGAWKGAFIMDLTDWHTNPGDEHVLGVYK
ncbi:MAG TPA: hypothetical protein VMR50_11050 [Myxococcota bacterium]|nr:hypothetical protein [Myxococcota bacterium]